MGQDRLRDVGLQDKHIDFQVRGSLDLPTSRSRIASGERRSREPRDRLVSLAGIWI